MYPFLRRRRLEVPEVAMQRLRLHRSRIKRHLSDQGFSITLQMIEFGEKDTRAYVSAYNGTDNVASFYDFDAKIIQGTRQLDADTPFDYDVKEVQEDLSPGVRTDGVMVFGKADPSQPMQVHFEWSSDNYNINSHPIVFEVKP